MTEAGVCTRAGRPSGLPPPQPHAGGDPGQGGGGTGGTLPAATGSRRGSWDPRWVGPRSLPHGTPPHRPPLLGGVLTGSWRGPGDPMVPTALSLCPGRSPVSAPRAQAGTAVRLGPGRRESQLLHRVMQRPAWLPCPPELPSPQRAPPAPVGSPGHLPAPLRSPRRHGPPRGWGGVGGVLVPADRG